MRWSDIQFSPSTRVLRQFALAWLLFFVGSGCYQYASRGRTQLGIALIVAGLAAGVAGLAKPGLVKPLFVGLSVLAFPIGWLVSTLMLLLMYFGVLTPLALFFRLIGRDPLSRKANASCTSYWGPKASPGDVRAYLRQY